MSSSESMEYRDAVLALLNYLRGKGSVCITSHRNADPDALAAAYAVLEVIRARHPSLYVEIVVPEGIERISKVLLSDLGVDTKRFRVVKDIDALKSSSWGAVIVVDTASRAQIPELFLNYELVVIDHHVVNDLIRDAVVKLYDPEAVASSEIMAKAMEVLAIAPSKTVASLLIAGILYDTGFLKRASRDTFRVMANLLSHGGEYGRVVNILTRREVVYAERIAMLKGLSRAGLYKAGDLVLVITCIGAYESSVLRMLQEAGADISLAIAKRRDGVRISVRASRKAVDSLGIPVAAELSKRIGEVIGGYGGGHATAGGVLVRSFRVKDFLKALSDILSGWGLSLKKIDEGRWITECGGYG
ncbi:MAG: hypothetical protein B6U73_03970 [Desulfurococcales archaeon ex4484_204]|nr:MAG: hypothetical protein B6U73_03970 [Desulfurococcales archaeon ex4484_204]